MSTSAVRSGADQASPNRPAVPLRKGNTAAACFGPTGRTVAPLHPGTAATNSRPASRRSFRAVSIADRRPAMTVSLLCPSQALASRSSTVTNQCCPALSRTAQW